MNSLEEAIKQSTCQKRITVCVIENIEGEILSCESNRCDPTDNICQRLNVVQNKENYDVNSTCNWIHAERNAINHLPKDCKPYKAILHGHDFYCDACEEALKEVGVEKFEIMK